MHSLLGECHPELASETFAEVSLEVHEHKLHSIGCSTQGPSSDVKSGTPWLIPLSAQPCKIPLEKVFHINAQPRALTLRAATADAVLKLSGRCLFLVKQLGY